ncbi:MAG: hypothetical protein IKH97_08560 [Bacteroidales bacterium]|nr:hypothetical protein [Bacteroidales bacterium]
MKKIVTIILLILPLMAAAQSHLYERYASRQELDVAQVSGFRLADSVRVDVVLIVAKNESAWQQLMKEFKVQSTEGSTSWLGDANNPVKRIGWTGKPVCKVIVSHDRRTVAFYHLDTQAQYEALLDYQLNAFDSHKHNKTKKRNNK